MLELVILVLVGVATWYPYKLAYANCRVQSILGTVALTTIDGVVTSSDVEPGVVVHENAHHTHKHIWQLLWIDVLVSTIFFVNIIRGEYMYAIIAMVLGTVAALILRAVQEITADKAALKAVPEYPEQLERFMRKVGAWKQPTWKHVIMGYMPPAYRIVWLKKLREEAS